MTFPDLLIIAGALSGGFVSGLTGFGTGITALAFWLYAVPPVAAAPLVAICAIVAQLQTLPAIWRSINWRRIRPFVIGGIPGVPIGLVLLPLVSVSEFKVTIGVLLLIYCSTMLFIPIESSKDAHSHPESPIADGLIGLGGGILGGLAALSGPLPTIWARFKGWDKAEQRGVFQAFNLSILTIVAVAQSFAGLMTFEVGRLALLALPGTILGAWLGRRAYERLATPSFNKAVLALLFLSGLGLVLSA